MIVNSTALPPSNLGPVDKIRLSQFSFFLGGSRRMREIADVTAGSPHISITNFTDYDFYATWSPQIEAELLSLGFKQVLNSAYLDDEAVTIFSNKLPTSTEKVQIVLRKDADFYHTVFESIDLWVYYGLLWKSSPAFHLEDGDITLFFNTLYAVAHAAESQHIRIANTTYAARNMSNQPSSGVVDDLDW